MTIVIRADGRRLSGTPVQIVQGMQMLAFGQEDRSLTEYMEWSAQMLQRMEGVELEVVGETDEERAASFIDEMVAKGLALRG